MSAYFLFQFKVLKAKHSVDTQVVSVANLWQTIDLLSVLLFLPLGSHNCPIDASPLINWRINEGLFLCGFVPHAHKVFPSTVR